MAEHVNVTNTDGLEVFEGHSGEYSGILCCDYGDLAKLGELCALRRCQ